MLLFCTNFFYSCVLCEITRIKSKFILYVEFVNTICRSVNKLDCAWRLLQTGPAARSLTASSSVPSSFRELMERRAEENNILFVPVPNRTQEGKQVYRFGRLHIYVDRGVIFALNGSMWSPVSLNSLVEMAR